MFNESNQFALNLFLKLSLSRKLKIISYFEMTGSSKMPWGALHPKLLAYGFVNCFCHYCLSTFWNLITQSVLSFLHNPIWTTKEINKRKNKQKKKVQCNVGVEMHVCFDFLITYSSLPNNRSSWNNRPGWNFYKLILSNSDEN